MLITKPIKQPREEKNQTEIKSPNPIKCALAFLSYKKPQRPNLANSYTGRLALCTTSQLTVGTCQHLCICPHGAIQSCRAATDTLGPQKGSHDLANSSSKIRETNTAITLSGPTAFSRYQGPEVAETSPSLWHSKQTQK